MVGTLKNLWKRNQPLAAVLVAAVTLLSNHARAQGTTGEIVGTVTDSTGSIIPNATVTIHSIATHASRTLHSNGEGLFDFNLVESGHYSVEAAAPGFKLFLVPDVSVSAGERPRVNAVMQVGGSQETVQVEATPPSLQTDNSTVAQVITERSVQDLPLNGRNFIQLAQLTPGATEGASAAYSSGNRVYDRRQTSSVSVNGNSSALNNQSIDGTDNNERLVGTIGVKPAIDAIAEFRVQSNLYSADSGRTAGAVINIVTKSGGDKFHGSAYEFFRNDVLNARDYFATTGQKPKYRQNQYGGSLGGPLVKNKTFFFADYEQLSLRRGIVSLTTVPTLFEEQNPGNFTDVGGTVVTSIDPVALNYFKLYPAPTSAATANNYLSVMTKTQDGRTADGRLDHHFRSQDQVFGRYTINDVNTLTPGLLPRVNGIDPGGNTGLFSGTSSQRAQNAQLNYVHVFRPNLLLELKTAYTRIQNDALPLNYGTNASAALGLKGVNLDMDTSALTPISIAGYASVGDGVFVPLHQLNNTFQYNGAVTWTFGTHSVKAGGAFIRRQANNGQATFPIGSFTFSGSPSYVAMQNFLRGVSNIAQRSNDLIRQGYRVSEPSAYVQDDWHAARNLTINYGIRYDIFTPYTESKNRLSNFDVTTGRIIVAGTNTNSSVGVKTDYLNIAPRIGFAYTAMQDTVIRGGFGLTYFPDNFAALAFMRNPPYATSYGPVGGLSLSAGFPAASVAPQDPNSPFGSLIADDKNLGSGRLAEFNLNLQHDFMGNVFTVGYVGEVGRQLAEYIYNINAPAPSAAANIAPLRPYYSTIPNVATVNYLKSGGSSSYHSFQVSLEHRYRNGLSYVANYTWSHALNDVLDDSAAGASYYALLPNQISTYDYGNSDLDLRNRLTGGFNYQLPFGEKGSASRRAAIGGWQVNGLLVYSTNLPVTVVNPTPRINTGVSQDRPNQIRNANLSHAPITRFFDTSVFSAQALGTVGNERRNSVYGPHQRHFDLSLFKTFQLSERFRAEFRAESFDLSNTPNFAQPNVNFGTGAFGTISSTAQDPREFQFALKLLF